jgi:hypothetical protein
MSPILAIVAPDAAAPADDFSPPALLRALAARLTSDPFACDGATVAVRKAGTALQAAISKVAAARGHLAQCEAEADAVAARALLLLTGG